MQVQHEAHLIEANPLRPQQESQPSTNGHANNNVNKSLEYYTLSSRTSSSLSAIEHISSCPVNNLVVVHLASSNQLVLYDTRSHLRRDRFPLKACDKRFSRQSFQLSGLDFSQDGQRLAVGQTDCIIYIYKFTYANASSQIQSQQQATIGGQAMVSGGGAAGGPLQAVESSMMSSFKPTISGKFASTSPITCLVWCEFGIVFGCQDGRVKLITMSASNSQVSQQSKSSSGQLTASLDHSAQGNSLPSPASASGSQPSKVINIFGPQRTGQMPISLAYRFPFLLIGLTDNTVQILTISMDHQATLPVGVSEGADLSLQSIQQQQQQHLSRRNSSQPPLSATWLASLEHSCPPGHLKVLPDNMVCLAGSDGRLAFHSIKSATGQNSSSSPKAQPKTKQSRRPSGSEAQLSLIHSIDLNEDIMALDYSNINEVVAVASKSRLLFVKFDQEANQWRLQGSSIELTSTGGLRRMQTSSSNRLKNQPTKPSHSSALSLTSLVWTRDGGQLLVGCSNGSLELFKCIYNKQSISDQLDICHIAKNRVRITDRERNLLATYKTQSDIKRVNLLDKGQSVIIWTVNSLLLARLNNSHLQSELQWSQQQQKDNKGVKFLFSPDSFVLLFTETNRELRIIKLGSSSNPKYCRRFHHPINRRLISVRQFPASSLSLANGSLSPQQKLSPNRTSVGSRSVSSAASQRSGGQPRNSSSGNLTLTSDLSDLLSAQQQQQQQSNLAISDQHQVIASNTTQSHESLYERFAFVDAANAKQLNIVELSDGDQGQGLDLANGAKSETITIESQNDIISLEFSFTSRYLIFRDSSLGLHLVELEVSPMSKDGDNDDGHGGGGGGAQRQTSVKESRLLLESCEFAGWIAGTDSLVAQAHHSIRLWFDLSELKRVHLFDSRSFNINMKPPLMDISLLSPSSVGADAGVLRPPLDQQSIKPFPVIRELERDDESYSIRLTNNQSIPLDSFRIKFYGHLIGGRLNAAVALLERQEAISVDADKQLIVGLYNKLAWMLIEDERQRDCELALRVFTRLNYKSLCKYLAECVQLAETGDEAEKELRLATLCGHWDLFEKLAEPERIVATYKRLNKWLRCIDYLERAQKFRQRDIAEQEHRQWLISRSRHVEAANIQANTQGDLVGALELLMAHDLFVEAGQLFVNQQKAPLISSHLSSGAGESKQLTELAGRLHRSLIDSKKYLVAAQLSERVQGEPVEALELYLKAQAYEEALGLISRSCSGKPEALDEKPLAERISGRRAEIQFLFGAHLEGQYREQKLSGRGAKRAIELYLDSGHPFEAFKLALDLRLYDRAFDILTGEPKLAKQAEGADQLREQCSRLGSILRQQVDRRNEALKAYEMASDYKQMIDLLIEMGNFERAYEVSLERVHSNNAERTSEQFIGLAQRFASNSNEQNLDKAEHIYLLLEKPDLAIEMYKQVGNYDKMLELIGKHRPDQLEGRLLHLARQLEAESRFLEAEKYLLRASPSEWTNVVRMYRLASEWPEAYRVARANCTTDQDPLLVQLAYWWAKSLLVGKSDDVASIGVDDNNNNNSSQASLISKARQLLVDLNVLAPVIEFCCETQNYTFAIELSKSNDQLRERVVLRYAKYLEQEHKFARAEQVLLENNLIDWAVKMYLDNEKQMEAINLIERQLQQHSDEPPAMIEDMERNGSSGPRRRSQLVELLNGTLIECANKLANSSEGTDHLGPSRASTGKPASQLNKNQLTTSKGQLERLQMAQQMYLRAQRPELAIDMYKARGMWQEAIQVAQRFAPRLLESLERALDEQVNDDIEPILRSFPSKKFEEEQGEEEEAPLGGELHGRPNGKMNGQKELTNEQPAAALAQVPPPEASQFESMRAQVDSLIRCAEKNKDRKNEARLGLSRFIFNLWAQVSDNPGLIGNAVSQLSQLVGLARADPLQLADLNSAGLANQDNLGKISALADLIFLNIDWWLASNCCVWLNLRHTLESCWCSSNLHLNDDNDQQQQQQPMTSGISAAIDGRRVMALGDWRDEHPDGQIKVDPMRPSGSSLAALERRLLVAHYVALHCSLANELQARLLSSAQQASSVFRSRPQFGSGAAAAAAANRQQVGQVNVAGPLSISRLEELSSRLLQEQPRQQAHNKESAALLTTLVDLLSKLSLSLLRYTDLVDCLRALYFAGLWQVAAGRNQLARTIWSLLIELADNNNNNNNEANPMVDGNHQTWTASKSSPNKAALMRYVDLPERFQASKMLVQRKQQTTMDGSMGPQSDQVGGLTSDQLTDVRQWLLETLIERSDQLAASDKSTRPLDARMSNQRPSASRGLVQATCLLTGLPALVKPNPNGNEGSRRDENDKQEDDVSECLILGARFNRLLVVRRAEWLDLSDCLGLIRREGQKTSKAVLGAKAGGLSNSSHDRRATPNSSDGDLNNVVEFLIRLSGASASAAATRSREEQRYK